MSPRPPFGRLVVKLKDQAEGLAAGIYPSLVSPSHLINLKDSQRRLTRGFMHSSDLSFTTGPLRPRELVETAK